VLGLEGIVTLNVLPPIVPIELVPPKLKVGLFGVNVYVVSVALITKSPLVFLVIPTFVPALIFNV
jgi:hypothetical protein